MPFAENLRYELDYQGLVVKELAARARININTLNHYLSGRKSVPPADSAVKIASALGVTVEYLVTGFAPETSRRQTGEKDQAQNLQKYLQFHDILEDLFVLPHSMLSSVRAMIRAAVAQYELEQKMENGVK
jgi:transcriptional regulator with XRE-family HTH domain